MARLPAHPSEEQCSLDEGERCRGRLGNRAFWPTVSPKARGDEAFPLVEAPRRGRAQAWADDVRARMDTLPFVTAGLMTLAYDEIYEI